MATIAIAVVAVEAVRRGRQIAAAKEAHRQQEAALVARLAAQEAELHRLTGELLPKAIYRLQHGDGVEEVLQGVDVGPGVSPEFAAAQRSVLRSVAEAVEAEEGLRDSAQRAFVNIARRVQAIVHQQATDLREMEDRHGNRPDVFGDLLKIDHGTALIGRLADSIAVLGGARPGRQWQNNVALYSVLRGAVSRITDYPRVEILAVTEVAVLGASVEPLIHALAELLDNATRYSPPKTKVRVTASEVQSGVAVEIEDGGIGLAEEARRRVERLLEEASAGLDLADLGESPRLGLAVVGRLSQAHGFKVSLRPSAYGGVRAVLVIPKELITTAPVSVVSGAAPGLPALPNSRTPQPVGASVRSGRSTARAGSASASASAAASAAAADSGKSGAAPAGTVGGPSDAGRGRPVQRTANGLPQRSRRTPATPPYGTPAQRPAPEAADAAGTAGAGDSGPATEPGLWLAAFQSAVSGTPTADSRVDESSDEGDR
ncbi:sensor histidine kinase [Yinghuangia soli]|uniref:sensor histidine kinase n=1 Tax=Yinghuangia soli TaxID=2908204 RepID=UPI0027E21AB9|nr:ATP-binding protein [Yinghuangia soli]